MEGWQEEMREKVKKYKDSRKILETMNISVLTSIVNGLLAVYIK